MEVAVLGKKKDKMRGLCPSHHTLQDEHEQKTGQLQQLHRKEAALAVALGKRDTAIERLQVAPGLPLTLVPQDSLRPSSHNHYSLERPDRLATNAATTFWDDRERHATVLELSQPFPTIIWVKRVRCASQSCAHFCCC